MKMIIRALAAVLILLGLTVGTASMSTAAAPGVSQDILPDVDCKEAPKPASPWGNPLALKPSSTSTADPFKADSKVTINEVYGTGYSVITYDNGCKPGSGMMPSVGAGVVNMVGLEWPATMSSVARYLQGLLVEPDSWIGVMDAPLREATAAITEGFWRPWITIGLLLVAALVLTRSLTGRLAGAVTAIVWSLLVLVVTSWIINYPSEATALVDDGVQTATVSIANGFSGNTEDESAARAMDRQWDAIDRATVYRTWLEASFGSSTSKTATTYGPAIFKSTHFTWAEWDAYQADPDGKGNKIIEAKAKTFSSTADKIKEADPIAYDYLTGNKWMKRISLAPLAYLVWLCSALFLLVSSVGLLAAYLVIRVLVPFAPAAGVIFLLEPLRDAVMSKLQKVAAILVMGPAYLLAALLVLRFNSAILAAAGIPTPLKTLMVAVISYIAWWLIRPAAVGGMGSKFGRMMRQAAAVRLGTRGLRGNDDKESPVQDATERPEEREPKIYRRRHAPVAEPAPLAIEASGVRGDGDIPHYDVVSTAPGTFTSRPAAEASSIPHRQARALPAPVSTRFGAETEQTSDAPRTFTAASLGTSPYMGEDVLTSNTQLGNTGDDLETAGSSRAPFLAGTQHLEDEPPTGGASTGVEAAERPFGDEAAKDGRLMPSREPMPERVHEANLTFTDTGEQVFEIYTPSDEIPRSASVQSE